MEKILHINSCIRGRGTSRTLKLYDSYIEKYKNLHECEVDEIVLCEEEISYCDFSQLEKRDELIGKKDFENETFKYARNFITYDKVIISAPYWDLSFPAVLKNYIEQICVCGLSFKYTEKGSQGLSNANDILYITTSGGIVDNDLGADYVKAVGIFLGIEKFTHYTVGGLDIDPTKVDELIKDGITKICNSIK